MEETEAKSQPVNIQPIVNSELPKSEGSRITTFEEGIYSTVYQLLPAEHQLAEKPQTLNALLEIVTDLLQKGKGLSFVIDIDKVMNDNIGQQLTLQVLPENLEILSQLIGALPEANFFILTSRLGNFTFDRQADTPKGFGVWHVSLHKAMTHERDISLEEFLIRLNASDQDDPFQKIKTPRRALLTNAGKERLMHIYEVLTGDLPLKALLGKALSISQTRGYLALMKIASIEGTERVVFIDDNAMTDIIRAVSPKFLNIIFVHCKVLKTEFFRLNREILQNLKIGLSRLTGHVIDQRL
jgi:hypothetical protein